MRASQLSKDMEHQSAVRFTAAAPKPVALEPSDEPLTETLSSRASRERAGLCRSGFGPAIGVRGHGSQTFYGLALLNPVSARIPVSHSKPTLTN